jgi:ADP-ribose pyrophosphatase YjhB (NUDIX family)
VDIQNWIPAEELIGEAAMRGFFAVVVGVIALAGVAAAQEQRPSMRYVGCRAADGVDRRLHEICEVDSIHSRLADAGGNARRQAELQQAHSLALIVLGEMGDELAWRDCIEASRAAQVFFNRTRTPTRWALFQVNIGYAQSALGGGGDEAAANEAPATLLAAIEAIRRDQQPEFWASAHMKLSYAYMVQGRGRDPEALRNAAGAIRSALEIYRRAQFAEERARAEARLAEVYRMLGEEPDPA